MYMYIYMCIYMYMDVCVWMYVYTCVLWYTLSTDCVCFIDFDIWTADGDLIELVYIQP